MSYNPWLVKNFRDYWYLNCPECTFKTKEVYNFKEHAVTKHPLSCELFRSFIVSNSKRGIEYVSANVVTEMIKEKTTEVEISDPLATLPKKEKLLECHDPSGINENHIAVKNENQSNKVSMPVNPKRKVDEKTVIIPNKKPKLKSDTDSQFSTEPLMNSPVIKAEPKLVKRQKCRFCDFVYETENETDLKIQHCTYPKQKHVGKETVKHEIIEKPNITYSKLITEALENSPDWLPLDLFGICKAISDKHHFYSPHDVTFRNEIMCILRPIREFVTTEKYGSFWVLADKIYEQKAFWAMSKKISEKKAQERKNLESLSISKQASENTKIEPNSDKEQKCEYCDFVYETETDLMKHFQDKNLEEIHFS